MEKYSKAVGEMYSQFKQRESHPFEKYMGRLAGYGGEKFEVVGYSFNDLTYKPLLIVDASKVGGWCWKVLDPNDVIFKKCEGYYYVGINDLID